MGELIQLSDHRDKPTEYSSIVGILNDANREHTKQLKRNMYDSEIFNGEFWNHARRHGSLTPLED